MNNIEKILIGLGVVGVTAAATYVVTKKVVEKKSKDISEQVIDLDNKDESVLKKIKKAAHKKVVKILAWVVLHQQQIEAVGTVLGIAGATLSVVNAVRDFRNGMNLQRKLDEIADFQQHFVYDKLKDIYLEMGLLHEIAGDLAS